MGEIFQLWIDTLRKNWAAGKTQCFHCGDSMRQSRAVEVEFAGERRKVCCHGCASVLKTVEQMGMQKQYFAQKAQAASQDEK